MMLSYRYMGSLSAPRTPKMRFLPRLLTCGVGCSTMVNGYLKPHHLRGIVRFFTGFHTIGTVIDMVLQSNRSSW